MKQMFAFAIALLLFINLSGQPKINSGGEPKWSPDGKQILYVQGNVHEVQVDGKYPAEREIMIMNADGTNVRQLTSNKYSDEYPALSPDGNTILFSSNRGGSWKLYTMNIDGFNQRDLGIVTSTVWNDPSRADWSPNGKHFVFSMAVEGRSSLHIANRDGAEVKPIPNGRGMYPHWSRDGKSFVFFAGNIFSINVDGTNRKQLTNVDPASGIQVNFPQWSLDGHSIYFLKGDHIFSINADGTNERQITNNPGQKWYLGLSSTNKLVYGMNGDYPGVDVIYVLEIDGTSPTLLIK